MPPSHPTPSRSTDAPAFDIVIPTVGRPSLGALLDSIAAATGPLPERLLLVHDRVGAPLDVEPPERLADRVKIIEGSGRGPAAARNIGWRASSADWIAFLDDDVVVGADWLSDLADDLDSAPFTTAGVQGRIDVPLPGDRRPTDWERNVAGLERAQWATADLAYRRLALETVGGFDERFARAYREDADLGLRLTERGWKIEVGRRRIRHPVRPADAWVSVRLQAGNAADPLMRMLHGPHWRERAAAGRGRRGRHLATTAAGVAGIVALARRNRRAARAAGAAWLAGTAELAAARIAPGPRTATEVATMVATSAVLPAAATAHWLRGWADVALNPPQPQGLPRPDAVLFDRDGTLVEDVPYNGDPDQVRLRPGAVEAIRRLADAGIPTAVISNQSGVARGLITASDVAAVNARVDQLLGGAGPWFVCEHGPDDGCGCRKPAPGLITRAAQRLAVDPSRCVVIGDIGSDVEAAAAVGARSVLVPTPVTRSEEIRSAPCVAMTLEAAVDLVLGGRA